VGSRDTGAAAPGPRLRVLFDAPSPAAWNMAVDEALLELGGGPVLRCYAWAPHAVSLGWFQRLDDFADLPAGTPIVRRLTGGGAIHHGDELTFSLALDAALLPRDVAASYEVLHACIVAVLAAFGVRAERARTTKTATARPSDRWCFATPTNDDLVVDGRKLLGSAQRRTRTGRPRVLHHGSLVLRRPALTPFVAAVEDQRPVDGAFGAELAKALAEGFAATLRCTPDRSELTPGERALATRLANSRYASAAAVARR
jgi:lipoyl(octanoyl) transferase